MVKVATHLASSPLSLVCPSLGVRMWRQQHRYYPWAHETHPTRGTRQNDKHNCNKHLEGTKQRVRVSIGWYSAWARVPEKQRVNRHVPWKMWANTQSPSSDRLGSLKLYCSSLNVCFHFLTLWLGQVPLIFLYQFLHLYIGAKPKESYCLGGLNEMMLSVII